MSADNVIEILTTLRRIGRELTSIEAMRAAVGLPKSVRETLSVFSNADGGTHLLGVDEENGVDLVELQDPVALRNGLVRMSGPTTPTLPGRWAPSPTAPVSHSAARRPAR